MKILILIAVFSLSGLLSGQTSGLTARTVAEEDPFIRYVATLPSPDNKEKAGFFENIYNFIAGNEPVVYNSPVTVFAAGIQNIWVVKGDGTILHYLEGKTDKVPAFRKKNSSFPSLVGICSFGKEGILFTDSRLNEVYSLSIDGKQLKQFNDTVTLSRPTGIAFSETSGEIWVAETGSHRISVFDTNGKRIKTIGKRGDGPLEFNYPTYIWIDSAGRVYIVDSMNFRVQILSGEGDYIGSFGKPGDATGTFARPRGVATDSKGNIYVVDALFNAVQIFDFSGRLLYYFGTQGRDAYQFWMPSGIFIDKNDFIYIADSYNSRIQIYQLIKNNQK
jgi:hypothetical protein